MSKLPRDEDGYVLPHDDLDSIPDDAFLVRYIHKDQLPLQEDGKRRLSSGAFSGTSKELDKYQGMSVDILSRLMIDGVDPYTRLPRDHEGAVKMRAGDLRSLNLKIGPDPMLRDDPYHACVWGVKKRIRKKIIQYSIWLIQPENTISLERL